MMNRRSFLGSILAAFAVRAGAAMGIPIALSATPLSDPTFKYVTYLGHFDDELNDWHDGITRIWANGVQIYPSNDE